MSLTAWFVRFCVPLRNMNTCSRIIHYVIDNASEKGSDYIRHWTNIKCISWGITRGIIWQNICPPQLCVARLRLRYRRLRFDGSNTSRISTSCSAVQKYLKSIQSKYEFCQTPHWTQFKSNQNLIHSKFISLTFHDKMSIHILHIQHTILDHTNSMINIWNILLWKISVMLLRKGHYTTWKLSLFVKMA